MVDRAGVLEQRLSDGDLPDTPSSTLPMRQVAPVDSGGGEPCDDERTEAEVAEAEDLYEFRHVEPHHQYLCCPALPSRTIPFRSASFSQVDINPEGKYVRVPRSPITLKPTAFCLNRSGNATPASGSSTFPRPGTKRSRPLLRNTSLDYHTMDNDKGGDPITVAEAPPRLEASSAESPTPQNFEKETISVVQKDDETEREQMSTDLNNPIESPETKISVDESQPSKEDDSGSSSVTENSNSEGKLDRQSSTQSENSDEKESDSQCEESKNPQPPPPLTSVSEITPPTPPPLPPPPPLLSLPSCPGGLSLERSSSATEGFPSIPEDGAVALENSSSSPGTNKKEMISRANSVSFSNNPNNNLVNRRYYKRLRGPYGEMLEAEMNKLIPGRLSSSTFNIDDDFLVDLFRESKSSSPSWGGSCDSEHTPDKSTVSSVSSPSKLGPSPPHLISMDDLSIGTCSASKGDVHNKFFNQRSRKISANLPVQSYPVVDGSTLGLLSHHQRTSSSPSQLLYAGGGVEGVPGGAGGHLDTKRDRRKLDRTPRGHVLSEILDTEKSYVDSLRIIANKYITPLKNSDLIDPGLVDEIFFKIPTILWHHERLLELLQKQLGNAEDDNPCVGDILLDTFRQNSLLECYSLFVNNWKRAKGSLKMAVASKPGLQRFLELQARQHKGKLDFDSLLIMPIQRIPRYELLIKELIKHTSPEHEDYGRLNQALDKVKRFATKINYSSVDSNREVEIEGWTTGLGHLVRQDLVTLSSGSTGRKERALFLFADSLVIASIKRKSAMRKPSSNVLLGNAKAEGMNWEGYKFKLLSKMQLTDVHILSPSGGEEGEGPSSGNNRSYWSEEVEDIRTIQRMIDLAAMLKFPHTALDDILKELAAMLRQQQGQGESIEFEIKSPDYSSEVYKVHFGTIEKKNLWLESFQDTLGKFVRYGFGKMPQMQFVQALPIRKTRAGLQLSCAVPVSLHNKVSRSIEMSDVWVGNSDGLVGQVCILTLHPEPSITSCNGVCNSRITCITSIPPPGVGGGNSGVLQTPSMSTSLAVPPLNRPELTPLGYESEEESHKKQKSVEHWSVWLGTEDGSLHIYDCSDSVRVKKNRHKIQHKSPLMCIVYFDNRVFVALGNGDVAIYSRNPHGKGWLVNEPSWMTMGSPSIPISKMITIGNQIWCVCGSLLKVYAENSGCIELLNSVHIAVDSAGNAPSGPIDGVSRGISNIATSDECIWVSVYGSSSLKCFHLNTCEPLFEINVSAEVAKVLTGCDDIIRQHKIACLRITALLVTPEKTLWIGTSAGVILTLNGAGKDSKGKSPVPLGHGHTGQVRFITCCVSRDSWTVISGGDGYEEFRTYPNSSFSSIVSFLGDGGSTDSSGREDSTNHLLLWRIPKIL